MSDREVTRVNVSSSRYTITEYANVPIGTSGVWGRSEESWIRVSVREWQVLCATEQEETKRRNWQDSLGTLWVRVTATCIQSGGWANQPYTVRGHKLWRRMSESTLHASAVVNQYYTQTQELWAEVKRNKVLKGKTLPREHRLVFSEPRLIRMTVAAVRRMLIR